MLRVAFVVIVILAGLQVLLPRIAARRLAADLRRSGDVDRVRVRAVPAVKLLFERADAVEIRMREARAGPGRLADLLDEARGAAGWTRTSTVCAWARCSCVTCGSPSAART